MGALLEIEGLVTSFKNGNETYRAVDGLNLSISEGQTLGIVGESGSGKSVTALSILRLIDPPGAIERGAIRFRDRDLLSLSETGMRAIRGREISMIFQEPMTSLNPVFTIGDQISEVFRIHQGLSRRAALAESIEMLRVVKIPAPDKRVREYPHQLSGGMRQRVMIAMALACRPRLLIADEPTTALDVTIQAQILELMDQLQKELGMAVLLITHDLGVVAEICDRAIVMYAGKVIEEAPVRDLFTAAKHPYTRGLLNSIPRLGRNVERLPTIGGNVPSIAAIPQGCRFHPRCSQRMEVCESRAPRFQSFGAEHQASCWLYEKDVLEV